MSLQKLFNPSSIAIVGVSTDPKKVGHLVAQNMLAQKYAGKLYFIHPSGETILGEKTYKNLKTIKKKIDLVVLAIPAAIAVPYLDEVAAAGCTNVVLFAAGFGETHTADGKKLEQELAVRIRKYHLTLLGPNCIGFINTAKKINATFFNHIAPAGNIGIISQSGALGSAMLDYVSAKTHLGISQFISLGNKQMLDESACLAYLRQDPRTEVIGMYLEDVTDGARFRDELQRAAAEKPVIVLKAGRTKAGSQAAMSHTGSLVGDDEVFEAATRQAGAIRASSFAEFQMLLKLYSLHAVPSNRNILVLSNAGGMGVLLADELIAQHLSLVTVSERTKNKLQQAFDDTKKISVHNPIDLLGDASAFDYSKAINLTMKEKDIGCVIVLLTPQANTEIMETAAVLKKVYNSFKFKPLYPIFMGKQSVTDAHHYFETNNIASFRYFASLPAALSKMRDSAEAREAPQLAVVPIDYSFALTAHEPDVSELFLAQRGKKFLNQYDAMKLLEWSGIKTAHMYLATSKEDLHTVEKAEGYPLVAKIASGTITHKTEVKGVITGITVFEELENAYISLTAVAGPKSGCYLQKEYAGHELIVGAKRDTTFGTVVLVGLGGVYAELMKEVVRFVYPLSPEQFQYAVFRSKLSQLAKPWRNMPAIDFAQCYDVVMRIGLLMERVPEIKELDINPLIASPEGLVAVDGRIICQ